MTATEKRCRECGETKPAAEFNSDKSRSDGLSRACKPCVADYNKRYYAANMDDIKARARSWEIANKDRVNTRSRDYALRNRERVRSTKRESARRRYWADPEAARKKGVNSAKRFRTNNRAAFRAIRFRHNARRRAQQLGSTVGRISYERIKRRDRMTCHICKKPVVKAELEFDHVIPLAKGGAHVESNIAVSHRRCNRIKSDKVLTLF